MGKVAITDTLLNDLADAIAAKTGATTPLTIDDMTDAVDDLVVPNVQASKSYTVSASGSATISPDTGYDAMEAVALTVPSGTAGTPTASKGAVSNHSVSVTPSVTNTTGYITGSTKTGTAVSVSASELVSGTYNVDSSGTKDVTNYASASIPQAQRVRRLQARVRFPTTAYL